MTRWRELPPIPKPVADQVEVAWQRACELFPKEQIGWSEYVASLLDHASKAVIEAYEARQQETPPSGTVQG